MQETRLAGKKCYISGKITGLSEKEYKANFERGSRIARTKFRMIAYNPVLFIHNHDLSWSSYMKEDLKQMMKCEAIYMLKGWKKSKGAKIEHRLAKELGFTIIYESTFRIKVITAVDRLNNNFLKKIIRFVFGIKKNVYLTQV